MPQMASEVDAVLYADPEFPNDNSRDTHISAVLMTARAAASCAATSQSNCTEVLETALSDVEMAVVAMTSDFQDKISKLRSRVDLGTCAFTDLQLAKCWLFVLTVCLHRMLFLLASILGLYLHFVFSHRVLYDPSGNMHPARWAASFYDIAQHNTGRFAIAVARVLSLALFVAELARANNWTLFGGGSWVVSIGARVFIAYFYVNWLSKHRDPILAMLAPLVLSYCLCLGDLAMMGWHVELVPLIASGVVGVLTHMIAPSRWIPNNFCGAVVVGVAGVLSCLVMLMMDRIRMASLAILAASAPAALAAVLVHMHSTLS